MDAPTEGDDIQNGLIRIQPQDHVLGQKSEFWNDRT